MMIVFSGASQVIRVVLLVPRDDAHLLMQLLMLQLLIELQDLVLQVMLFHLHYYCYVLMMKTMTMNKEGVAWLIVVVSPTTLDT